MAIGSWGGTSPTSLAYRGPDFAHAPLPSGRRVSYNAEGRVKTYLLELYRRADLIGYLISSGLKAQHRNSILGYLWWLLDPLLGVLIYYFVVVGVFSRGGEDYGPFLVIGMVVWRWLGASAGAASQSIVKQAGIITHVAMPKIVFPITETVTGLVHFGFGLLVVLGIFLTWGIRPGAAVVWLPAIVLAQFLFTIAIAAILGYFGVFLRDLDVVMSHVFRVWFFASPVIWTVDMLPAGLRWIVDANPMAWLLSAYRDVLMYDRTPPLAPLVVLMLASLAVIGAAVLLYSRHEHRIVKAL